MCRKNGIRQEYPAPYTPQENGKNERVLGTVTGTARCMLETAGQLKQLWPYVLATTFYVKNRCFHSAHNCTPYERFFGERPNLSQMQLFGCRAFVLTEDRKKLDSKAQTGIFLGYSSISKCFIVWLKMELLSESRARCGHQGTWRSTWTASQAPVHLSTQTWLTIVARRRQSSMTLFFTTWWVHHQILSKQK